MSKKQATETAETAPAVAIDVADLAERLKPTKGGAPRTAQFKVLERLLTLAGDGGEIEMPNLSALGREIGLSRQCIANALLRLRRRGLVEERTMTIPVVARHRKVRLVVPHMPGELRQLALPFEAEAAA